MEPRDILRREFDRIAIYTDAAFEELAEGTSSHAAATYKDWAALLLRYHDAIERIAGKQSQAPVRSMKRD